MSLLISLDMTRQDFSLSVHTAIETKGVTALYGPSGAGKTTLLRWLAGLEPNTKGLLSYKGKIWQDDKQFVSTGQRQIGYVFQDARLFPHLTVQANLHFAWKRRFNNHGPTLDQVCQWFDLEPLLNSNTVILSGGEQQRVAIARALLSSPQILLMDEPLVSLDEHSKQRILQHLENLQHHLPIPILYVSHDLAEVSRLADHLLLIEKGRINAQGPLLELLSRLDLSLSQAENAASIIEGVVAQHDQQYQLTTLSISEQCSLQLSLVNADIGQPLRVRIPAKDVSITLGQPCNSSILNILPAIIDSIEPPIAGRSLIRLKVGGQYMLVKLTHKSVDRLQLQTGQHVYAQIKTVALLSDSNHKGV